jgi:hypothetical protein
MALTVNSAAYQSGGQPSAPLRLMELNVDLDASYPNPAGYPVPELVDESVCEGLEGIVSDGTTALKLRVHADRSLHAYVHATGVEVANGVSLAAYTGVKVPVLVQ